MAIPGKEKIQMKEFFGFRATGRKIIYLDWMQSLMAKLQLKKVLQRLGVDHDE